MSADPTTSPGAAIWHAVVDSLDDRDTRQKSTHETLGEIVAEHGEYAVISTLYSIIDVLVVNVAEYGQPERSYAQVINLLRMMRPEPK